MTRVPLAETMMRTAMLFSSRSTCSRRSVGCVLTNKDGIVIGIGFNGVARGQAHCNEGHPCDGVNLAPGEDFCRAIHAEQNAIIQCSDVNEIHRCFVTLSPCRSCIKLLLNTPCREIVFAKEWEDEFVKKLWTESGRLWTRYQPDIV